MSRPTWMADGLCAEVDPELWFPGKGDSGTAAAAKRVCAACPVLASCRDYAIAQHDAYGVWGGMTRRERLAQQRRTAA